MPPTMKPLQPFRLPPKAPSKIGVPPDSSATNPGQASFTQLKTPDTESANFTYFTALPVTGQPDAQTLYTADRPWVRVTLMLESAGPVAVGTKATITPVLGGNGILLPPPSVGGTVIPITFNLAKGNKLYIASTSINRVKVQVDPFPWLQDLFFLVQAVISGLTALAQKP